MMLVTLLVFVILEIWRKAKSVAVLLHAGLGPQDIDVIELHDCFSANELITYEALGLCPEGKMIMYASTCVQKFFTVSL